MSMSTEWALNGKSVTKKYSQTLALKDVNIQVAPGSFYGLLGPNGAGKSTLMKLTAGVLTPSTGTIEVFGSTAGKGDKVRRMIGYVPQDIALYESLSAKHNLQFFGAMYGVEGPKLNKRIEEVLEFVGLSGKSADPVKTFSGGMKRRLNVAAAILHQPDLLLLDEPTVGIDPQSRNRMFEMFKDLQSQGTTILYSSHYLEEVEELCDSVGIIDHGDLIEQGRLSDLLASYANRQVYLELQPGTCVDGRGWLSEYVKGTKTVTEHRDGWIAEAEDRLALIKNLAQAAQEQKLELRRLEMVKPSLESVFLKLTGTSLRDN